VATGRLIALEGIDGCGKTTQAHLLAEWLDALCTFEPGATSLGVSLRALLLDPDRAPVDPRAEALLLAADRAQHVAEVIGPTLAAGRWVVTDRYVASTVAYQGFGRGLDRQGLDQLAEWATGGLRPDLTVLLDLPVAVATSRRAGSRDDRFEAEGEAFLQRVADGFRALATEGRDPWLVVDATDPADVVAATVRQAVGALPGTPAVSEP
jgi:dTMP kinase